MVHEKESDNGLPRISQLYTVFVSQSTSYRYHFRLPRHVSQMITRYDTCK